MQHDIKQQQSARPLSASSSSSSSDQVFQKGIAISVWQNSPDAGSQWTSFMRRRNFFGQKQNVEAFTQSNDFWNRYEEDIQLVKALGCNAFRFSFEWARIEPQPGRIDRTAIAKYHAIIDCLEAHDLLANATFHHFTHPQWFEAAGGFTEEKNIPAFESYCQVVFGEFGRRIPFWATFNEPSCFCLCGYIMGLWAPGRKLRFVQSGRVLANLLRAHVAVYRAVKATPAGQTAQIGLVHQHIRFIPACNWIIRPLVKRLCGWMNHWFAAEQVLTFFTTGRFTWRAPLLGKVIDFVEPAAPGSLDFWGINYYSRPAINSRFQLCGLDASEPLTDMGMPLVASDMHHHLLHVHNALGVPIIVTETGVSDRRNSLRARAITSYYREVLRAIADGVDVRGVFYWTLMDNIEWHHGFNQYFGLYDWRPIGAGGNGRPMDGSVLQLRQGSKALVAVHAAWPDSCTDMRAFAQQEITSSSSSIHGVTAAGEGGDGAAGNGVPVVVRFDAAGGASSASGSRAAAAAEGGHKAPAGMSIQQQEQRAEAAAQGVAAAAGVAGDEAAGDDAERVVDLRQPLLGAASSDRRNSDGSSSKLFTP